MLAPVVQPLLIPARTPGPAPVLLADVNAFTGGQFEDDATLIVVGIP